MKDLYIIGAGGFGREVAWLVKRINEIKKEWELKGFVDDDVTLHGTAEDGYPVLGGCDYLNQLQKEYWVVCAVGNSSVRKRIVEKIQDYPNLYFATVIDPRAEISERVEIGEGTIICAGNIITVDIKLGRHNIINLDCTIGHDAVLEDYVTLYPSVNVSGMAHLCATTEIGTGTQIIQGKTIGSHTIVGAGAVVVKDIPDDVTAVGNPAKVIKIHNKMVSPGNSGGYQRCRKTDNRATFYGYEAA